MPSLQTPCGIIELPEPTRERLEQSAREWSDEAGDAFVAGLSAMANGQHSAARDHFAQAARCLAKVCSNLDESAALPVSQ